MTVIQFLGEWIVRSSILVLAGWSLLSVLRVKNPRTRLAAWTALLAGSLAIPLIIATLPKLPLAVMRPPVRPPETVATELSRGPVTIFALPTVPASIPTSAPKPVSAKPFPWMRAAAILYGFAALALLLRLLSGLLLSMRVLRGSRPTGLTAEGAEVRECDRIPSPVTVGVLRPAVLLPADWRDWDSSKLEAVLAHEQSHIRRRDPALQLISGIHRALLWASPLSWFLDRSIVRTAEQISDDDAIAATRDRVSYAEILLEFVQRAGRGPSVGVAMARYDRPAKRIRRILNSTTAPRRVTRGGIAAILLLAAPLAYVAAAVHPQSTPQSTPRAASVVLAPSAEAAPTAASALPPAPEPEPEPAAAPQPAVGPEPAPPSPTAEDSSAAAELSAFEVASIKLKDPSMTVPMGAHVYPGGRVTIFGVSLKTLIETAFGLSYSQISGGDEWTGKDLYMVEAKPPAAMQASIKDLRYTWFGIEDAHLREMLQALLIDRFQLRFHRETKTGDVYLLEQSGKPLRLRPVETRRARADGTVDDASFGCPGYVDGKWSIFATSMPQLAKFAYDFVLHVPVLDRTELSGSYDYTQRVPDLEPKYGGDQSDSFVHYLTELGLKLERAKGPVEYFAIDHAAKPSPN